MAEFLGNRKIRSMEPVGDDEVKITLKDNSVYTLPKILVDKMTFKEATNIEGAETPEDFQTWKLSTIAGDLVNLLTKAYHLRHKEVEMLMMMIQNKVNNDFNLAQMILWGKGHYEITLMDVRNINDKAAKEDLDKAKKNNAILQNDLQRHRVPRGR